MSDTKPPEGDLAGDEHRPESSPPTPASRPRASKAADRFAGSAAAHVWRRLDAMDLINRAMLFAAVLFLCFVPFLIIVSALAGRSATTRVVRHFGLTGSAADATTSVFTSPTDTSNAIGGLSYVLFVLGGLAAAGAIQELYERAFELDSRGLKDTPRRFAWLALLVGAGALTSWAGPGAYAAGGPVLLGLAALIGLTGFWWLTMWILLGGRVHWRAMFPSALATAVCWLGMSVVFRFTMSGTITGNYAKYGAIGVVLAFMSFLIAVGVVIMLGAVFGVVWRERRQQRPHTPSRDASA